MSAHVPALPLEADPLIAEAKQRARRRRLVAAAALLLAILGGTGLVVHALAGTSPGVSTGTRGAAPAATSGRRCAARIVGTRILAPGGSVAYRDPYPGAMLRELHCSGSTEWAVFVNGIGTNVESYVGVRSLDRGRTWRVALAQDPRVRLKRSIGAEVGPWALHGSRAAYFLGICNPCQLGNTWGTVSLTVTKDAGRTFRSYPVPALAGWAPLRIRASGREVTIWARREVRKLNAPPFEVYRHKVVRFRVG